MNTATRVLPRQHFRIGVRAAPTPSNRFLNYVLLITILFSAFFVLYIKDLNRRLFIQFQTLQTTHDKLHEDWGKLLLEQSTWSTQARVQRIAQLRLGMNSPSPKEVVVIRRPH